MSCLHWRPKHSARLPAAARFGPSCRQRVAFVNIDACMGSQLLTIKVLEQLQVGPGAQRAPSTCVGRPPPPAPAAATSGPRRRPWPPAPSAGSPATPPSPGGVW
jgi:hypothetical protein